MSISLNISDVIAHVKNIVDGIRCTVCDKSEGGRVRFRCGHTSCEDCLVGTEGCMLCLSPPTSLGKPRPDQTLSRRVQNASVLLNVCQDTFNLDVYRRLRVSEQLKAEKELFPECIQAPAKYINKRKSITLANKENVNDSLHLGEHTSHTDTFKMKKCNNYVQQWLEESQAYPRPRKALADLNVNDENNTNKNTIFPRKTVKKKRDFFKDSAYVAKRKRSHSSVSFSLLERENSVPDMRNKKIKKSILTDLNDKNTKVFKLKDNEESGIVLDDEPILIEDSQTEVIDKDKLALLAVQVADKERSDFTLESTQDFKSLPPAHIDSKPCHKENIKNVLFYKKTSLAECCFDCKVNYKQNNELGDGSKNISITIENQHFVTSINISKCVKDVLDKRSVFVQTNKSDAEKPLDIEKNVKIAQKDCKSMLGDTRKNNTHSLDWLQSQDGKNLHENNNVFKKGIIIDDSDSDDSCLESSILQVTAEVHQSSDPLDYGILSEISTSELPSRSRYTVRGVTPDSNNSSDKENCDPNKRRKEKNRKKSKYSKKLC